MGTTGRKNTGLFLRIAVFLAAVTVSQAIYAQVPRQAILLPGGNSPPSFDHKYVDEVRTACTYKLCPIHLRARTPRVRPVAAAKCFAFGDEVHKTRQKASKAAQLPESNVIGWTLTKYNPAQIVAVFPSLKVRNGFVLRGYQFNASSIGSGHVWAFPVNAPYPGQNDSSEEIPSLDKPKQALSDTMLAIEGDGSPWSYLCASLLRREFDEFGARWHGQYWTTHTILSASPWNTDKHRFQGADFATPSPKVSWKKLAKLPLYWRPTVTVTAQSVTVVFYTYSPLGQEAIYRHVDIYSRGSYRFQTKTSVLARGPGYMIF